MVVLVLAVLWAWADVFRRSYFTGQPAADEESATGPVVLRLAHWQLEAGFRRAIEEAADDYRRTVNPRFQLVQEAIPEGIYGQWVTSQLIGGTAPDLIAPGQGLQAPIWVGYLNRYFLPITDKLAEPNPHNRGTELEGVPFKLTFRDQMRSGYVEDLRAQYGIPLYIHAARLFYNRQLLEKLTGRTSPPTDLAEFLETCSVIASRKDDTGRFYTPIASSGYHAIMWDNVLDNLTYNLLPKVDVNRDGFPSSEEFFVATRQRWVNFDDPTITMRLTIFQAIARYFQPGWLGLTRDEAVFLFAQQRAVFISAGTWDARSLQEQADGLFDLKVMPFPWPAATDSRYDGLITTSHPYDRANFSMGFAITRSSRHPDVAFDFLQFLASKSGNEKFTETVGWIPGVVGARLPQFLEGFSPQLQGQYNAMSPTLGGRTDVFWNQQYQLLQIGNLTPGQFQARYASEYATAGMEDFRERLRNTGRTLRNSERLAAGLRGEMLSASEERRPQLARDYAARVGARQLLVAADAMILRRLAGAVEGEVQPSWAGDAPPGAPLAGPYVHRPDVLRRARERLLAEAASGLPAIHDMPVTRPGTGTHTP